MPGDLRTFGRLVECNEQYTKAGSKERDMKKFFNVVNPPLINAEEDQVVGDVVPPPELHLLMGATNHKLELI